MLLRREHRVLCACLCFITPAALRFRASVGGERNRLLAAHHPKSGPDIRSLIKALIWRVSRCTHLDIQSVRNQTKQTKPCIGVTHSFRSLRNEKAENLIPRFPRAARVTRPALRWNTQHTRRDRDENFFFTLLNHVFPVFLRDTFRLRIRGVLPGPLSTVQSVIVPGAVLFLSPLVVVRCIIPLRFLAAASRYVCM